MSPTSESVPVAANGKIFSRRAMVALPVLAAAAGGTGSTIGNSFESSLNDAAMEGGQNIATQGKSCMKKTDGYSPRYCLNTSTINGSEVPLRQQLKIAADAGYHSVELWLRDIEKFVNQGGSLMDLRSEIVDLGLEIDGAIGFSRWIVDEPTERSSGLEQFRREADMIRQLGGSRMAAPPAGMTNSPRMNLDLAAQRYRELLTIGHELGITAQLELWGFSTNLSTLAEVLYVAAAANHPQACILLDIYHLYKGGNDFLNMSLVPAANMPCLHINDYPGQPDRQNIADKDRVFPGDGVAPLVEILRAFFQSGFRGALSLELFNRSYWEMPPENVARIGLEKMKQVVEAAGQPDARPA
jgi:2-keto-myo-inositol isomerase